MTYCRSTEHAPDAVWMEFTGTHLPDAEHYWLTDIDTVIRDRNGNMMLLELKYNGRDISPQQRSTLLLLDQLIKAGVKNLSGSVNVPGLKYPIQVHYAGAHLLQLSGTDFENSTFTWDRKPVTKDELIRKLTFGDVPH